MLSKYRAFIVLAMDICIIFACNFLMFFPSLWRGDILPLNLILHISLLTFCILLFQSLFRTYDSLWRYAESREYLTMLGGMALGLLLYCVINGLLKTSGVWIRQAVTGTELALLIMLAVRFGYRIYRYRRVSTQEKDRRRLAIIGAGRNGMALLEELLSSKESRYVPYCFLDDAPEKQGKRVQGYSILGPIDRMQELLRNTPVTDLTLAIPNLTAQRRSEILQLCAKTNCQLHILTSSVEQLQNGSSGSRVREVQIEDLLGREPVTLATPKIAPFLRDRTILVTGGGGSIGSELCRQIATYGPRRLVVLDISENSAYELQMELHHRFGKDFPLTIEIASVRDRKKLDWLFQTYRPELVFHAAAHKHVPLMENNPEEAIKNNVFGTYYTALMARKYGVEKFVLISTDKAVNPTNIMGTTKYLCEQVLQALRGEGSTEFAAVRFGNVLGSNGSVIPLFKKQIANGGPVTLTDRRIIRYFMTIPEAVQLVLEAGSFAKSGEIFVLDMGEPVKILDLAENLIRLSGYTPHVDIKIEEVGLRPGEKLYEELLTDNANLRKTENRKIFVEENPVLPARELEQQLDQLSQAMEKESRVDLFRCLHRLVPTFRNPDEVNREAVQAMEEKNRETAKQEENRSDDSP